jgi:hypothetical protein
MCRQQAFLDGLGSSLGQVEQVVATASHKFETKIFLRNRIMRSRNRIKYDQEEKNRLEREIMEFQVYPGLGLIKPT